MTNFDIHIFSLLRYSWFTISWISSILKLIQNLKRLYSIWSYYKNWRDFLAVQWLRLHASTAGGMGLIPGPRELWISYAHSTAKKRKENIACISLAVNKFLYFIHSTLYLLISYLYLAPLPYPSPLGTTRLSSVSVSLFLFCIFIFLYSTDKR